MRRQDVLGWSFRSRGQAVVFTVFVAKLAHAAVGSIPPTILELLRDDADQAAIRFDSCLDDVEGLDNDEESMVDGAQELPRGEQVYRTVVSEIPLNQDDEKLFLDWCLRIARSRVESIVQNKHRGAYERAANVAAACVEVLLLRGEAEKSAALKTHLRTEYSRFSAFQRKLARALAPSHQLASKAADCRSPRRRP